MSTETGKHDNKDNLRVLEWIYLCHWEKPCIRLMTFLDWRQYSCFTIVVFQQVKTNDKAMLKVFCTDIRQMWHIGKLLVPVSIQSVCIYDIYKNICWCWCPLKCLWNYYVIERTPHIVYSVLEATQWVSFIAITIVVRGVRKYDRPYVHGV